MSKGPSKGVFFMLSVMVVNPIFSFCGFSKTFIDVSVKDLDNLVFIQKSIASIFIRINRGSNGGLAEKVSRVSGIIILNGWGVKAICRYIRSTFFYIQKQIHEFPSNGNYYKEIWEIVNNIVWLVRYNWMQLIYLIN